MILTQNEREQAEREGWIVANDCEIQRLDDPDIAIHGYENPKFDCDEAVRVFIQHWADRGSPLHVKALAMIDPPVAAAMTLSRASLNEAAREGRELGEDDGL